MEPFRDQSGRANGSLIIEESKGIKFMILDLRFWMGDLKRHAIGKGFLKKPFLAV